MRDDIRSFLSGVPAFTHIGESGIAEVRIDKLFTVIEQPIFIRIEKGNSGPLDKDTFPVGLDIRIENPVVVLIQIFAKFVADLFVLVLNAIAVGIEIVFRCDPRISHRCDYEWLRQHRLAGGPNWCSGGDPDFTAVLVGRRKIGPLRIERIDVSFANIELSIVVGVEVNDRFAVLSPCAIDTFLGHRDGRVKRIIPIPVDVLCQRRQRR